MATDSECDDSRQAQAIRDEHGIPVYLPVCASDDERRASKIGGMPWLDEPWPVCPTCTNPLRFVLQLRRDNLPPSCHWAFGADLIQLFLCDASGKPDSPEWLCQAGGNGWAPFAPSTLVRQVDLGAEDVDLATAMPIEARLNVARLEHAALADFAEEIGMAAPAAPADLSDEYRSPRRDVDLAIEQDLMARARRIGRRYDRRAMRAPSARRGATRERDGSEESFMVGQATLHEWSLPQD